MIFSKFVRLDYKNENGDITYENSLDLKKQNNERFEQILKNSSLYASKFDKLNDIDECRYRFSADEYLISKFGICGIRERFNSFRSDKQQKFICSFSRQNDKYRRSLKQDLLWAHYADGCCGARIDFEIDRCYCRYVHEVKYDDSIYFFKNFDDLDANLIKIMTKKNLCWKYEQEYRAIFDSDSFRDNRFPITIKQIILGRKFCKEKISCNENENKSFDELENLKKIAKQIILICSNNYMNTIPKILAYKTMYSSKPKEIKL